MPTLKKKRILGVLKQVQHRVKFMGIDPGLKGGVSILELGADGGLTARVYSMPRTEREVNDLIASYSGGITYGVIERVHAMPGQGVTSMFTFGRGYGGLRMSMIANGIPFNDVTPQAWMKKVGTPKRDKGESKLSFKKKLAGKARQLFPNAVVVKADDQQKRSDTTIFNEAADSLLIAYYCYMEFK